VIGQDPICTDLYGMGLGLSLDGWAETMCDEGDRTWLSDSWVGYIRVFDNRSQCPVFSALHRVDTDYWRWVMLLLLLLLLSVFLAICFLYSLN